MHEYYDSSAFAKLFLIESGTDAMKERYVKAESRMVSRLAFLEVRSAIRRLERDANITSADAARARQKLNDEMRIANVIPVSDEALTLAGNLIERNELKSLDAIQLACALVAAKEHVLLFVTCDKRLMRAVISEGLQVLDPTEP